MIEVSWVGEEEGYEVWIPFYFWDVIVSVKETKNSKIPEDISIYTKDGTDVTDQFLTFNTENVFGTVRPTGRNLYQVLDILRTNLKEKGE